MIGVTWAYDLLVALTGVGLFLVLLLFAHRRIPRAPSPDSVHELRADFDGLAEVVEDLTIKHEESLGRAHAKVGHYRRKLRRMQEEEGDFGEDEDSGDEGGHPEPTAPARQPTRAELKSYYRQAFKKGADHGTVQ